MAEISPRLEECKLTFILENACGGVNHVSEIACTDISNMSAGRTSAFQDV